MMVRVEGALYGFAESGKRWFDCLSTFLRDSGYVQSEVDPCILFKIEGFLHKVFLQHQAWVRILMTAASDDSVQGSTLRLPCLLFAASVAGHPDCILSFNTITLRINGNKSGSVGNR
jgi:hypothetical protein